MASSSLVAPSSTPSAAARVFAIPELLEHILYTLGSGVVGNHLKQYRMIGPLDCELEPSTTIARCQMVNRDFRCTIIGSKKIQRLIEYTSPAEADASLSQALGWLFLSKLGLDFTVRFHRNGPTAEVDFVTWPRLSRASAGMSTLDRIAEGFINHKKHYEDSLHRYGTSEASWCRIKLSRVEDDVAVSHWGMEIKGRINGSGSTTHFVGQGTLGDVFDKYDERMQGASAKLLMDMEERERAERCKRFV